jgi:hypothetical protein
VYCGLATKATRTHAAIRTLIEAGNADDAMALTRVLIENLVAMMWIRKDIVFRLDAYIAASELHDQRLGFVAQTHYAESNPPFAEKAAAKERDASGMADHLGGKHHTWARDYDQATAEFRTVPLAEMFDEVFGKAVNAPAGIQSAMYDVAYLRGRSRCIQRLHPSRSSFGPEIVTSRSP